MSANNIKSFEAISLSIDNNAELNFNGRLFAESTSYDDEIDLMSKHKLYLTDDNAQVYSVISSLNNNKSKRAYKIALDGDNCQINNGKNTIDIPFDMLMFAVRSLCGIDKMPSISEVEQTLRAANS